MKRLEKAYLEGLKLKQDISDFVDNAFLEIEKKRDREEKKRLKR